MMRSRRGEVEEFKNLHGFARKKEKFEKIKSNPKLSSFGTNWALKYSRKHPKVVPEPLGENLTIHKIRLDGT